MSIVETPNSARPMDLFTIRWIGYGITVLATALPILLMFAGPGAAQMLTLASIAVQVGLLALIERMPQAFMVIPRRSNQEVINFVLVIPVAALAVAGSGALFVQPEIAGLVAAAAGAAGLLAALLMPRSARVASPAIFGLFVACYAAGLGWGSMAVVNRVFDTSPGQVFQAVIQNKWTSWSSRGGRHYYVVLEPWGPVTNTITVGVGSGLYDRSLVGSTMCATLHAGALGVAWYNVAAC